MKYCIQVASDSYHNEFHRGNDWKHQVIVTRVPEDDDYISTDEDRETESTASSAESIEAEVVDETTIEIPSYVDECYIVYGFEGQTTYFACQEEVMTDSVEAIEEFDDCIQSVNRELHEYLREGRKVVNLIDVGDPETYHTADVRMTTLYERTPHGYEFPDVGKRWVVHRLVRGRDFK